MPDVNGVVSKIHQEPIHPFLKHLTTSDLTDTKETKARDEGMPAESQHLRQFQIYTGCKFSMKKRETSAGSPGQSTTNTNLGIREKVEEKFSFWRLVLWQQEMLVSF